MQALTRAGLPFQKRSHDRLANRPGVQLLARELRLASPAADPAGAATDTAIAGRRGRRGRGQHRTRDERRGLGRDGRRGRGFGGSADVGSAGSADTGSTDTGSVDVSSAGSADTGSTDTGSVDVGSAGSTDTGSTDMSAADGLDAGAASGAAGGSISLETRLRAAVRAVTAMLPAAGPEATDVRAAADVLLPLARRCGDDLGRFLTEISLGAEADAADPRADAVALLTLHAAKGLEFPVVFVAGCEEGLLPLRLPDVAPDEERRLLFVGMTRAGTKLFLTWARRRGGGEKAGSPSPFLTAISPDLITRTAPTVRRRPTGRQLRLL